jgi:hypothetical protein
METIAEYGMHFLESCFPFGIPEDVAKIYMDSVIDGLA